MKTAIRTDKEFFFGDDPTIKGIITIEVISYSVIPTDEAYLIYLQDSCRTSEGVVIQKSPRPSVVSYAKVGELASALKIDFSDTKKLANNIEKTLQLALLLLTKQECLNGTEKKGRYFTEAENWLNLN